MAQAAVTKLETPQPRPQGAYKIRFVTAASLFDGHDASINIMRRILQSSGVEVIHLGHNRSVNEIVRAAIQEDVQGIAVSSYQGGHIEYFKYMVDLLREQQRDDIKVFAGGGGVIIPAEVSELESYGVTRIYTPEDGQRLGLQGMIDDMVQHSDFDPGDKAMPSLDDLQAGDWAGVARLITSLENGTASEPLRQKLLDDFERPKTNIPVLGITGTGGSGKSSLTDELILRFRLDYEEKIKIGVIAIDPSRKKTGGALLGDRIRMNAIDSSNIYMRSLATRDAVDEVPDYVRETIAAVKRAGVDLIIVETPGIGQGDTGIVRYVDTSLYVMTPEFGAASQLEKIDMLDYADIVAINKFDRRGAEDALRDVRKQMQRNQEAFDKSSEDMPVFGTMAAHFNDDGVTALYQHLSAQLHDAGLKKGEAHLARVGVKQSSDHAAIVPTSRQRYLAEIADQVRSYRAEAEAQCVIASERYKLTQTKALLEQAGEDASQLDNLIADRDSRMDSRALDLLNGWSKLQQDYSGDEYVMSVHDKEIRIPLTYTSLSGTAIPKVCLPNYHDHGDILRWLLLENVPGKFPYTAGVFEFKREAEDPTRMFAGEGDAFRTNKRFKYLSSHSQAKRLSTAFDSVTLYGSDPDERPDIYGKVGNSGVSIATLDDMEVLYDGFDLCDPQTSVSMTINGPAPAILAMFLNTAIDQQTDKFERANDRAPNDEEKIQIKTWALENVRGTVQADILKEDQGQNTCLFSTEFSLKVMGDIQEYFIRNRVRNFYSVSISGYHIAEAGANPITQLAFTLANGFTYVEAYLARGMHIDDFAPNLSFFFSNGMDPEYSVMGRVARRIWATAMRDKYGANERSQKLKYHIQTSGRSLHAQEIDFNDIRTTLQALIAVYDNCNSLHTNAHDEAITTPTEDSVRRAMAIQLIINREWGLAKNENPSQGSFLMEELTDLVEEAVLQEFERISERGGVLGAMERGYQRGKIQDESIYYEHKKHDGSLPIIGVNTFLNPSPPEVGAIELARSTEDEKQNQIKRLRDFESRNEQNSDTAIKNLQNAAMNNENVFSELMEAVKCSSLGQITDALFQVGGKYRRNM
ncbi:MAG: methylmalonyl-CoA mutase family protein [Gammaproteobacteria bacterium]|nr:methylmalonyl-CoA mutase family protein [Gammaproteobacteria bacterium]